jgi:hypothetical protein
VRDSRAAFLRLGLVAAAAASATVLVLVGCTTIEGSSVWDITLRNDTPRFVIVKECTTPACVRFRYTKRLLTRTSVRAFDYGDGTSWWLVQTQRGRLGCLSLGISKRNEGAVLDVSSARACSP